MAVDNPYQESKRIVLETLPRNEVVIKLFEEASKQIRLGILLIEKKKNADAYNAIAKAQKIISRLNFALDMSFPISVELNNMYNFIFEQLGEANVKRDADLLNKLWEMVNELKDTFKEANKISSAQR